MTDEELGPPPTLRAAEKEKPPVLRAPPVPGPDDVWDEAPTIEAPAQPRHPAEQLAAQLPPSPTVTGEYQCPHCEGRGFVAGDTIGHRLYRLRRQRKLTISGARRMAEIDEKEIKQIELGLIQPTLDQLCAFADAYDVSLDELAGRTRR